MKSENILRSAAMVGACTAGSRVLGLVRNMVMASAFGTSVAMSAFVVAFRIPNLFRGLFGEGALSAAFVPVFTEAMEKEGAESARDLASRAMTMLGVALGVIVLVVILISSLLLQTLDLGSKGVLIVSLLRIMLPYAMFICMAALSMGILNSHRHFFLPAITPVMLNVVWILGVLYVCPHFGHTQEEQIFGVAWSIVVAGIVQLMVQVPGFRRIGLRLKPRFDWKDGKVRRILLLMGPAALATGVFQVNVLVASVMALMVAPWAAAALSYAEFLVYLPLALVATSLGTVLLPTLSRQAARDEGDKIRGTLGQALNNLVVVMIPAAVGLTVLAEPIVRLLYEWPGRQFDAQSTIQTVRALVFLAPGLPFFGGYKILVPIFYALKDTRTPVRISIRIVVLNFLLNVVFILSWPVGFKHAGLMFATVLSSATNAIILGVLLHRRIGSPGWRQLAWRAAVALVLSALMGVVVHVIHDAVAGGAMPAAWLESIPAAWRAKVVQALAVGVSILGGVGVYAATAGVVFRRVGRV